jgi:hypothetical protein
MARTIPVAFLAVFLPVLVAADTPRFHFTLVKPVTFTMKQTTIVLDDDEKGIPHRLVVIETSAGTLAPAAGGGYLLTRKPTNFEVLVDGHHIDSEVVGSVVKNAAISMTIDSRGLAKAATGYDDVQKSVAASAIVSRVLARDLAGRDVAIWNDRMLMSGQRAEMGADWKFEQPDGTKRTWRVTDKERCDNAECLTVRSNWEADPNQLLQQANRNTSNQLTAARLEVRFEFLVDPATLLPHYEKRTTQQFMSGKQDKKNVERRVTKIDEVDYRY